MTRLQQEVSRQCRLLGCSSEHNEQDGSLQISYEGTNFCCIQGNDHYIFHRSAHQTEDQENMFYKVENLIHKCNEYITAYNKSSPFDIEGISNYRKLSEFNGVLLGVKDMGKHGFQFSSWLLTYGGTGATLGDYSFDYDYSKRAFAERSGLVDKCRQFTNEQLEDVYRCLAFTKEMNDSLTYDQDKTLDGLMEKLEYILPYVKDNPDYIYEPEEDSGITM